MRARLTRARESSAALVLVLALGTLSLGCSAVIGGRPSADELLPCWIEEGIDPCPVGTRCLPDPRADAGRCVPMCVIGADEVCNNYDDDCDGTRDEPDATTLCPIGSYCLDGSCRLACQVDGDMDGFATCGMPADCDDTRAGINPTAREICDGIDNDCDPSTSDSLSGICPDGQTCTTPRGEVSPRCIAPDCTNFINCMGTQICNPDTGNCETVATDCRVTGSCGASTRCDPASGVCVPLRDLGVPCTADVQCSSERCTPFGALGIAPDIVAGGSGLCISACCNDRDCPTDFRCWTPATGVRACVPATRVPVTVGVSACSQTGTCASNVCDVRSVENPPGATVMFVCAPHIAGTTTSTTDICVTSNDCGEGFCNRPSTPIGTYPEGWCGLPCRTSDDCDYAIDPFVSIFAGDRACRIVSFMSGERLQFCVDVRAAGPGANGAACTASSGCRDGYCRDNVCSGVCCSDADCGAGTEVCAPVNRSGWEMRCVARFPEPLP